MNAATRYVAIVSPFLHPILRRDREQERCDGRYPPFLPVFCPVWRNAGDVLVLRNVKVLPPKRCQRWYLSLGEYGFVGRLSLS